jgi:hypothetical protein
LLNDFGDNMSKPGVFLEFIQLQQHMIRYKHLVIIAISKFHQSIRVIQQHIGVNNVVFILVHGPFECRSWGLNGHQAGGKLTRGAGRKTETHMQQDADPSQKPCIEYTRIPKNVQPRTVAGAGLPHGVSAYSKTSFQRPIVEHQRTRKRTRKQHFEAAAPSFHTIPVC